MKKVTKASVNYRQGKPGKYCEQCTMFLPLMNRCTLVKGSIHPKYTCDDFIKRKK